MTLPSVTALRDAGVAAMRGRVGQLRAGNVVSSKNDVRCNHVLDGSSRRVILFTCNRWANSEEEIIITRNQVNTRDGPRHATAAGDGDQSLIPSWIPTQRKVCEMKEGTPLKAYPGEQVKFMELFVTPDKSVDWNTDPGAGRTTGQGVTTRGQVSFISIKRARELITNER